MANQLRSVVKLSKVKSVFTGHTYSIRATQALENGHVVKLGDLEATNIEVHGMAVPTANSSVVLIANPAIIYDNARLGADQERYYSMETGEVVRAYELSKGDVFGVTKIGVEGTPVVGGYLVTGTTTKLKYSATAATGGFCAKIIRFDRVGGAMSLNVEQAAAEYVMVEVLSV